jgi:hypothetical protein
MGGFIPLGDASRRPVRTPVITWAAASSERSLHAFGKVRGG